MMPVDATLITTALITHLPLAVCAFILTFTRRRGWLSAGISLAASSVCLIGAAWLLFKHRGLETALQFSGRWMVSGDLTVAFGYLLDPLSLLMLLIVATISFLVQFYSLGYMAGDPGMGRYYAFLSLFAWAMLNLTAAYNILQLYIFWELVGLSSYLLIGFWYEKFSASEAGKKAFVMTRFGDIAFFFGILLLLVEMGQLGINELNQPAVAENMTASRITWAALLIFGGIVGKSAQFPLLTWLPDAMEGPTPVSALLHSATMVAAGVYLLARMFPFFSLSPTAMTVCLLIGTISLLLASTMAMVSRDIKQVWAYSTISQLGFMLMGLGAGAYTAGVFHLSTHAGFKALLFLCSGVFIHTYETNDMFALGRAGGRELKIPMVCMLIAAAALSGLPPLSGFFSKELILARLAGLSNPVWLIAGLLGAFLTAYYAFRLLFIMLFPRPAQHAAISTVQASQPHHHHREYAAMAVPLLVLALITLTLGWFQSEIENYLVGAAAIPAEPHHAWLPYLALGLALAGVALAWLEFGRRKADQIGFVERWPAAARLFAQRWFLDHLYRRLLDQVVYNGFSKLCTLNDRKVIDGGLDGLSLGTVNAGRRLSGLHAAMMQYRLLALFAAVLFMLIYLLVK